MNPDEVADWLYQAVRDHDAARPRQQQRRIGVSDVGHCREYARLRTIEETFSDQRSIMPAFIGTAVGDAIETAVVDAYPEDSRDWTLLRQPEITVTLPSGLELIGHPDLVTKNLVLDLKTKDGVALVRRTGVNEQQQFQRHLYAWGLIQAGILTEDCWVGNAFFDRSGREEKPYVDLEPFDQLWVHKADEWLSDVIYAVENGEEAPKDKPIEFCQQFCEFFTVCRAEDVLADHDGGGLIEDPELQEAIYAYVEARNAIKLNQKIMDDARRVLAETSGTTPEHVVKWTHVGEADIPGYSRAAYDKLDIRALPKARRR